jgi:hypothetical protein
MVSLHPEGFAEYDVIYERVRALKNMGYRLIVRVVGHPAKRQPAQPRRPAESMGVPPRREQSVCPA